MEKHHYVTYIQKTQIFLGQINRTRLCRILAFGLLGVLVQTVIFEILVLFLKIFSASTAVVLAAEAGILTNFIFNNAYSFNRRTCGESFIPRLFRFHIIVSGSVFLQWLFVFIAEHATGNLFIIHGAYVTGIVLGFIWNYVFYHLYVWRKN